MELISFVLYILDNQQMSQYNDVIVYVVINFVQILFHIWAKTLMVYPCMFKISLW